MSIIKCPECSQRVSSLAGTCPHCGVAIRGNIKQCPTCKTYVLKNVTVCPVCSTVLQAPAEGDEDTAETGNGSLQSNGKMTPKNGKGKRIAWRLAILAFCIVAAAGAYYYYQQQQARQHEEEQYARLETLTDPEYYQQFLIDFPQSSHYDEVKQRMDTLIQEDGDWKSMLAGVSRNSVMMFMEKHPQSARRCICENMLDSIDWADAVSQETPEAIDTYLNQHPEGQHVTEAANRKNELAMSKITPEDKALVRGALEAFLNNGLGKQDTTAIRQCCAPDMESFCGTAHATPSQIAEYAKAKMAKDVIGLHYLTGADMSIRRQSMPDSSMGFAVEFTIDETMARKDPTQNTARHYRASALLNAERKIVKLTIR